MKTELKKKRIGGKGDALYGTNKKITVFESDVNNLKLMYNHVKEVESKSSVTHACVSRKQILCTKALEAPSEVVI